MTKGAREHVPAMKPEKKRETETHPGLHTVLGDRISVLNTCSATLDTSYRDYVVNVWK